LVGSRIGGLRIPAEFIYCKYQHFFRVIHIENQNVTIIIHICYSSNCYLIFLVSGPTHSFMTIAHAMEMEGKVVMGKKFGHLRAWRYWRHKTWNTILL
jgi:hypothetical protein